MDYNTFLQSKKINAESIGFSIPTDSIHPLLFDWQRDIVRWALLKGRAALFEECGLGKTLQQLEWAKHVAAYTKGKVLIFAPLAVAHQTVAEGLKIDLPVKYCRSQEAANECPEQVIITNYDMAKHFDMRFFQGVVSDESSILKSFTGKTKRMLLDMCKDVPYRLCCTATPAPNDHLEFGNHAEFLGLMDSNKMISRWFINDTMAAGSYRLKHHAEKDFWRWMTTWAVCISKPSDLGDQYQDNGFLLPPLVFHENTVKVDHTRAFEKGQLFIMESISATDMWREKRLTSEARCQKALDIVNENGADDTWIIWCDTNDEADRLVKLFPNAVEVSGNDSIENKEEAVKWFCGEICNCQLTNNKKRDKLAACGNQNMRSEDERNITLTQRNGKRENPRGDLEIKTENICEITTSPIGKNGSSIKNKQETKETQDDENDTPTKTNTELPQKIVQRNGEEIIQKRHLHKTSNNSDLPQTITEESLNNKMENALFVGKKPQIFEDTDYTLTTTIEPEKSEGCCAPIVIQESGNSEIVQNDLNKPFCTCEKKTNRILISKSDILGWGLNFQHCSNQIFVGVTYSFEKTYQSLRRSWRFGQKETVNAFMIYAETEGDIIKTLNIKQKKHREMQVKMNEAARMYGLDGILNHKSEIIECREDVTEGKNWKLFLGDSVKRIKEIPDNSVDLAIFSPPFSQIYVYTDVPQDMGNNEDDDAFFQHFNFLIPELWRITKPGRLCVVHCKDLPLYMNRDGAAGLRDFPGAIIREFESERFGSDFCRWTFHSRVTIWKDPVIEMQRTKNHGLLWSNMTKRGEVTRQGMADYLIVFRKWLDLNDMPQEQVQVDFHSGDELTEYVGDEKPEKFDSDRDYSIQTWQKYASPVWFDINQTRVLNARAARDSDEEKHICPLQLDVIARCVQLWTNKGDTVFSPFAGIGSEGYESLRFGRKFVGIELKEQYWQTAINNLTNMENSLSQPTFFDYLESVNATPE